MTLMKPRALKASDAPLAERYQLALLDLDGVVYRGADPVAHAAEGIRQAERLGMQISYTTNNPSRYPRTVAEQLEGFGLTVADNQVITSAIVAARMLAARLPRGAKVLVVGREHLREQLEANGLVPVARAADGPDAVIQSWHQDLSWGELAEASYALRAGARYFVTNTDLTIPREGGIAPGNGAMQLPVIAATGKHPEASAGKPEAAMYDEARELFAGQGQRLVPVAGSLPVGDRLDTDIEAANRGGYDSLVVLTGVATPRDIITAAPLQRPTYIAADLRGLTRPQPAVEHDAAERNDVTVNGVWRCGNAQASIGADNALAVTAVGGDRMERPRTLDALRAACCCAWDAVDDHGVDVNSIIIPDFLQDLCDAEDEAL